MKGIIYKITNKVNNKSYIGQTRYTIEFRWRQHLHKKDNTYFHNALHKYGAENFTIDVLEECDVNHLNEREMFYIAKYDTFNNGYNLTLGGDGNKRVLLTDSQYDEIKELYLSGFSAYKISELFNVDKSTIIKILKGLGVKIRSNKLNINQQEFQELVSDYKSGYSLKSLAKRYDCSAPGLKDYLIRKGVDIKQKYSILDNEEDQMNLINDYLDSKLKLKEIQQKYHSGDGTRSSARQLRRHQERTATADRDFDERVGENRTRNGSNCISNRGVHRKYRALQEKLYHPCRSGRAYRPYLG